MNVSVGFLGYFIFNCLYVYLYVCETYKHVYMCANTHRYQKSEQVILEIVVAHCLSWMLGTWLLCGSSKCS